MKLKDSPIVRLEKIFRNWTNTNVIELKENSFGRLLNQHRNINEITKFLPMKQLRYVRCIEFKIVY